MRKVTVALVAVMILFAGCSGGGGGAASPTETSADTTEDGTPMDGTPDGDMGDGDDGDMGDGDDGDMGDGDDGDMGDGDDGDTGDENMDGEQPDNPREITNLGSSGSQSDESPLDQATEIDVTVYNGTENLNVLIQNDTAANTQLLQLSSSEGETTTLYSTSEYSALRNTSTGEVQYGAPDSGVGGGVAFASIFVIGAGASYFSFVEWEEAGTTTVNGESAYVYEADSLNQTTLDQQQSGQSLSLAPEFNEDNVQSVDGEIVVGTDGRIYSIMVEIETADGTYGTDIRFGYDDITIEKPDWVDESQAP